MTRRTNPSRAAGNVLADVLEQRTGYRFRDVALAELALTHASAPGSDADNERLEFLGDRVLGLTVARLVFDRYPDATQGELAVRLNAMVRSETCAEVARNIGLLDLIHADNSVKRQSSRNANKVLSDAVEALIAAIYLDGGADCAEAFIVAAWKGFLADTMVGRDPKTELQHWAHQVSNATPAYATVSRDGPDHAPRFTVTAEIPGYSPADGVGRSKREAEQAAAAAILVREGVWPQPMMETE